MTSQPHASLPRAHHRAFGVLDVKLVCVRLQATAPCHRAQRQCGAPAQLPAAALRQALVFASGLQPTEAPSTRSTCAGASRGYRLSRGWLEGLPPTSANGVSSARTEEAGKAEAD